MTDQAARFGVLVDRFGIPWLINCEESDQTPETPNKLSLLKTA